ncbi:MAG: NUDIX hydrolase [Rhodothermaeota bacterium MED-G64]|nr:MAG: NUDIX hydrolase [Rhodothermaeota bacterium MED-G64]
MLSNDSIQHGYPRQTIHAAGGVVTYGQGSKQRLLIMFRRGVWDLPKGKVDPGETWAEAAIREVVEETGIAPPVICESIGLTQHQYHLDGQAIDKTIHWYWMEASLEELGQPQTEEGITELQWVSLREAHSLVGFDNLRLVLDAFGQKKWGDELITP